MQIHLDLLATYLPHDLASTSLGKGSRIGRPCNAAGAATIGWPGSVKGSGLWPPTATSLIPDDWCSKFDELTVGFSIKQEWCNDQSLSQKRKKKNIYVTNQYESSESSYHIEMSVTVRAKPANPPPHPPLVPQHKKGNHLSPAL
jgi:hypothetical protein